MRAIVILYMIVVIGYFPGIVILAAMSSKRLAGVALIFGTLPYWLAFVVCVPVCIAVYSLMRKRSGV